MLTALIIMFAAITALIAMHVWPLAGADEPAKYSRYFDDKGLLIDLE